MDIVVKAEPEPVTLDTGRTALIVVDMQNSFAKKGGMFDVFGMLDEAKAKRVIANDRKVIDAFHRKGMKVIYLRMGFRADLSNAGGPDSPNYWKERGLVMARERPEYRGKFLIEGTPDWQIIEELKPQPGDIVVNKNRFSGFFNTDLNSILRSLNIKHLVFAGIATNVCVESTLRDAFFHEFFPVLVSDACGNMGPDFIQEATVWNVSHVFGWVTSTADLLKALK